MFFHFKGYYINYVLCKIEKQKSKIFRPECLKETFKRKFQFQVQIPNNIPIYPLLLETHASGKDKVKCIIDVNIHVEYLTLK